MPKPLSRKYVEEEYESDGGFVEDAPKGKKRKSETTRGKSKASAGGEMGKDDEGNEYWEISGKRRVQISQYKNQTMVGIREFYEKDGKMLPGKKVFVKWILALLGPRMARADSLQGISLSTDQYIALVGLLPEIEKVLVKRGIDVPRPKYGGDDSGHVEAGGETSDKDEEDAEEEEEEGEEQSTSNGRLVGSKSKKNHEATSDEDEDGE